MAAEHFPWALGPETLIDVGGQAETYSSKCFRFPVDCSLVGIAKPNSSPIRDATEGSASGVVTLFSAWPPQGVHAELRRRH